MKFNKVKNVVHVTVESQEDNWYLSHIITSGDFVSGITERKIKVGQEPNVKTVRKKVWIKLEVEKVEYEPEHKSLRILGPIVEGPEDVSKGSYHSFSLEEGESIKIEKEEWGVYEIKKLKESLEKNIQALLVIFDREEARFAKLDSTGFEEISKLKGDVQKKGYDVNTTNFYKEINSALEEYVSTQNPECIVIASPSFWKEYLEKELSENVKKRVIWSSISGNNKAAFKELLRKKEVVSGLKNHRVSRQEKLVQDVMRSIAEEKACIGLNETKKAVNIGAVEKLFVTESFLRKSKEESKYKDLDKLLSLAESMQGEIHIVDSEEIDGVGGICGILRWKS